MHLLLAWPKGVASRRPACVVGFRPPSARALRLVRRTSLTSEGVRTSHMQVLTCLCLFTVLLLKERPGTARHTGYSAHLPLATWSWILVLAPGLACCVLSRASWNGTVTSTSHPGRSTQVPAAPLTRCPALYMSCSSSSPCDSATHTARIASLAVTISWRVSPQSLRMSAMALRLRTGDEAEAVGWDGG